MTGHAILAPMLMAVIMGLCLLAFCTVVLAFGYFSMGLGTAALDTLALVALILLVAGTLGAAIGFGLVLNVVKIPLFKGLRIA